MHVKTAEILEDKELCNKVSQAYKLGYPKRYIQQKFDVSRRQLEHIVRIFTRTTPYVGSGSSIITIEKDED
ncbi:hypothetical protein K8I28_07630 [bacterium]|nr:hypothetical protein [bacterium]